MDRRTPPSAAELGITDVEYERIMRDLRRRRGDEPQEAPAQGRRPRRWRLIVLALVVAVGVVTKLGAGDEGPSYAFLETVNGQPVTYSSCRPIQVAVYPAGGPADAEALVREAVSQLRAATGLDIVVTGVFGGYAPNWNFKAAPIHPDDPISVSWQNGDAIAEITDHIAGIGGSRVIPGPRGTVHFGAGTIALSRDYYASLSAEREKGEGLAVLLHEFGHVFGLDHVGSRGELMYKSVTDRTSFGPGDLEGLRILGQGPCT